MVCLNMWVRNFTAENGKARMYKLVAFSRILGGQETHLNGTRRPSGGGTSGMILLAGLNKFSNLNCPIVAVYNRDELLMMVDGRIGS